MLTPAQQDFAQLMVKEAQLSSHIWPEYAAAEACLESAWGESKLCQRARNVFGLKVPSDWEGPTISMRTEEFLDWEWKVVPARWPVFDVYRSAFSERLKVLCRLAPTHPDYAEALAAANGDEYIHAVSRTWSTDKQRAEKVLAVMHSHPEIFGGSQS